MLNCKFDHISAKELNHYNLNFLWMFTSKFARYTPKICFSKQKADFTKSSLKKKNNLCPKLRHFLTHSHVETECFADFWPEPVPDPCACVYIFFLKGNITRLVINSDSPPSPLFHTLPGCRAFVRWADARVTWLYPLSVNRLGERTLALQKKKAETSQKLKPRPHPPPLPVQLDKPTFVSPAANAGRALTVTNQGWWGSDSTDPLRPKYVAGVGLHTSIRFHNRSLPVRTRG